MKNDIELHLQVTKKLFNDKELKPLDMLILSLIKEFERNNKTFYMKDETLSNLLHVSTSTISRAITRLAKKKYIQKDSEYVIQNGTPIEHRIIKTIDNAPTNQNDNIKKPSNQNDREKEKTNIKNINVTNQNDCTEEKYKNYYEREEVILTYRPRKENKLIERLTQES